MWTTSLESTSPSTARLDAAVEVLVETDHLAVIRVTLPPASKMPRHAHGESEALLIPLAGQLLVAGGDRCVERLAPGVLATLAAHERVSVENPTTQPASMLVCFGPATFVETLPAAAVAGVS
jgi:quercetin dioxygenase-like cupin family protein